MPLKKEPAKIMHRLVFSLALCAMILLALLSACQNGDPLPVPSGPFEPLNGWNPDGEGATAVLAPAQVAR
jgi:hypothetical protein